MPRREPPGGRSWPSAVAPPDAGRDPAAWGERTARGDRAARGERTNRGDRAAWGERALERRGPPRLRGERGRRVILVRAYWCHAAGERDPGLSGHIPERCLVPSPERALEWMRASVRAFAGVLDHEPFVAVWRWLSDAEGMDAAIHRLRGGGACRFAVATELGPRSWNVHPVLVPPLLDPGEAAADAPRHDGD